MVAIVNEDVTMSAIDPQTRMKILSSIARARAARVDHLMSDVQFARLNDDEIRFAHQARSDAAWSSIAAVFFASVAWRYGTSSGRAVAAVLGALLAAFAVHSALFRETLVLDFRSRTWTRHRRLLGFSHIDRSGVFNDLEGLILSIEPYSSRDLTLPAWIVRLAIHGEPNAPALAAFLDEERAYEWFTALVETLQLPVIDRTSVPERRCSWKAFERPLSSKPTTIGTRSASEAPPRLPPDSAIRVIDHPHRLIVLPMPGFEADSLPWFLLGAAMISYAAIMWRNSMPLRPDTSALTLLVPAGIGLLGLLLASLIVGFSLSHEELHETGSAIVVGRRQFGRLTQRKVLDKRWIEEIAIKPGPMQWARGYALSGSGDSRRKAKTQVFVRSTRGVLHVGGTLTQTELEWLRATLLMWLAD